MENLRPAFVLSVHVPRVEAENHMGWERALWKQCRYAAQALLALAEAHAHLAGSLHASLVAAVLCLTRGCTPAALLGSLQLPRDAALDVRRAGILRAAQLVWDTFREPVIPLLHGTFRMSFLQTAY